MVCFLSKLAELTQQNDIKSIDTRYLTRVFSVEMRVKFSQFPILYEIFLTSHCNLNDIKQIGSISLKCCRFFSRLRFLLSDSKLSSKWLCF